MCKTARNFLCADAIGVAADYPSHLLHSVTPVVVSILVISFTTCQNPFSFPRLSLEHTPNQRPQKPRTGGCAGLFSLLYKIYRGYLPRTYGVARNLIQCKILHKLGRYLGYIDSEPPFKQQNIFISYKQLYQLQALEGRNLMTALEIPLRQPGQLLR